MIWLSAMTTHNHCWVGHQEVARGEVFGDWKRFSYLCNGHVQYIYCRTQKVFLTLFNVWVQWAKLMHGKYVYSLESIEGVDISTPDIIMDNPGSRPFRVKSLIQSQYGEYIQ